MTRMSLVTAIAVALVPAAAPAQTVQEQAYDIILESMAPTDFPLEQQIALTECFTDRLTEAEATALVAADGLEAQQAVIAAMAEHGEALLCASELF